jgi:predicted site-specific integrase-resolvase
MSNAILLTDGEAAGRLRMLPIRLVRLAKAGRVPCVVLPDGEIRFSESDLREWVETHKRPMTEGGTP